MPIPQPNDLPQLEVVMNFGTAHCHSSGHVVHNYSSCHDIDQQDPRLVGAHYARACSQFGKRAGG